MDQLQIENYFQTICNEIGLQIHEAQFSRFKRYFEHLVDMNQHMNLTGITDLVGVYIKHFYDSIYPISRMNIGTNVRILDIGPGAGFPSLPIHIIRPDINFTLIETLNKRVKFLENLCLILDLNHVKCVHGRAEDLAHDKQFRESFDFVIVRAVSNLSTLVEVCVPYLNKGGKFICLKGPDADNEIVQASTALRLLNAQVDEIHEYDLPDQFGGRTLITISKSATVSSKFPRKQGLPFNKPLS